VGSFVMTGADLFAGAVDLGQFSNKLTVSVKADELDVTPFNSTAHARIGGLKDFTINHEGFAQSDYSIMDATLFADLANQRVCTACPFGTDGDTAYFGNAVRLEYDPTDSTVGGAAAFSGTISGSDGFGLIRGQLLLPKQTVTAVGVTGTGQNMGLVGATQKLYTAIHCFSAGTTATVIVESDDNSGFTSAITRSSTVVTAAGGTFVVPVSGAIASDIWWRVRVASVTGSFSLAVAVGIQ